MSTRATGTFTFTSWDEKAYSEVGGDGRDSGDGTDSAGSVAVKLTHAHVTNDFHGEIEGSSTIDYLMVYLGENEASFVGYEQIIGRLAGRSGSFVLFQEGRVDAEGVVHAAISVVPGSGTAELAGLSGKGSFVARHGITATPLTLDYDLP